MFRFACFLLCTITIHSFALAGNNSGKSMIDQQILHVGHIFFPPFYTSKDEGMDADLVKAVAKQAQFKQVEFVQFPNLPELMLALNTGKIDVIANGIVMTPERQQQFLLSEPYYLKGGIGLLYDENKISYRSIQDLNQFKLGTLTGAYSLVWIPQQKLTPKALKTYDSWDQLIDALKQSEVNGIIGNFTACRYEQQKQGKWKTVLLQNIPIVYVMRKDNIQLQQKLNQAIKILEQNRVLYNIQEKYLQLLKL